jgi:hypothetical protein
VNNIIALRDEEITFQDIQLCTQNCQGFLLEQNIEVDETQALEALNLVIVQLLGRELWNEMKQDAKLDMEGMAKILLEELGCGEDLVDELYNLVVKQAKKLISTTVKKSASAKETFEKKRAAKRSKVDE